MRTGPIVAFFLRVPLGSRSSQPGGTIKNLPILPPCEELLPPTTPKDSSEAPFEAVLARDGFFYALTLWCTLQPASEGRLKPAPQTTTARAAVSPPDDSTNAGFESSDSASACESISRTAGAAALSAAPRASDRPFPTRHSKMSRAVACDTACKA